VTFLDNMNFQMNRSSFHSNLGESLYINICYETKKVETLLHIFFLRIIQNHTKKKDLMIIRSRLMRIHTISSCDIQGMYPKRLRYIRGLQVLFLRQEIKRHHRVDPHQ